jgi:hypothetical protein
MSTAVSLAYEGAPSCIECQRVGVPVCDHVGFTATAWDYLIGHAVHVPGLDDTYQHRLTSADVSADRKTITLVVETDRPAHHDLARHLSTYTHLPAKALVQAVHHETGDVLEEGHYDRFLTPGMQVAVDRDLYTVVSVDHPHRTETGSSDGPDVQVARLAPVVVDAIRAAT